MPWAEVQSESRDFSKTHIDFDSDLNSYSHANYSYSHANAPAGGSHSLLS
jgi:hypothetical protein